MICINFPSGAMGHMLLKTVYLHWPEIFSKNILVNNSISQYSNHDALPDLFLSNHQAATPQQLNFLKNAKAQHLVLCHNTAVIPDDLFQNINFVNVLCDQQDKSRSTFLFMCKSGKYVIDWANQKGQEGFNFYEIVFRELVRIINADSAHPVGVDIQFRHLHNYYSIIPVLEMVQRHLDLDKFPKMQTQYLHLYNHTAAPLTVYRQQYCNFDKIFNWIINNSATHDLWSALIQHKRLEAEFKSVADFFVSLCDK
jgi:hypothetical protein